MAEEEPGKGKKRTEWITREYDEAGDLVEETVTVKVTGKPKEDEQPELGGYL